jgi:glycolate oxidase FAD binding subunit
VTHVEPKGRTAVEHGAARSPVEVEHALGVREAFVRLLGADAVSVRGNFGRWHSSEQPGTPVLLPRTEEEVADCLRVSTENRWQILPVGAATWLPASLETHQMGALLSVSRLDRIVQYEPADLTLAVGAGLSLAGVEREVAKEGQWLPVDPPGIEDGTLGGTLATGSSGGLALAYGAPRDLVLGLKVVTGDGRVLRFGGGVVKNVAGFDLVKLAVGSWGTLGVITEASVRLFPRPRRELLLVARGARLEDLVGAARIAASAPFQPAGIALLEQPVEAGARAARAAALVVRLAGAGERVEREAGVMTERLGISRLEALEGGTPGSLSLLAELRLLEEGAELGVRMKLPPSELSALVAAARSRARLGVGRDELTGPSFRLAVDVLGGSVRLAVPHVRLDPPWEEAWAERLGELRRNLENAGGSLTVLHGPPGIVRRVGMFGGAGGASRIMERLKAQFDPAGILPPGAWCTT